MSTIISCFSKSLTEQKAIPRAISFFISVELHPFISTQKAESNVPAVALSGYRCLLSNIQQIKIEHFMSLWNTIHSHENQLTFCHGFQLDADDTHVSANFLTLSGRLLIFYY